MAGVAIISEDGANLLFEKIVVAGLSAQLTGDQGQQKQPDEGHFEFYARHPNLLRHL